LEIPVIDTTQVFWPAFKDNIPNMSAEDLRKQNWIGPELLNQLILFHPQSCHIAQGSNGRDLEVSAQYFEAFFPPGRVFASYYQLVQCVTHLGDEWGFGATMKSKKVSCTLGSRDQTRKVQKETLKDKFQCPFYIGYSIQGFTEKKRKEGAVQLHYPCKVTQAVYKHTCDLTPVTHRLARTVAHKNLPKLDAMKEIIELSRVNSHLPNDVLREHIRKIIPSYLSLSSKKMEHFRRYINRHIMNPVQDLGADDLALCNDCLEGNSANVPAYMEYSELADDPITRVHFRKMLQRIMQEGGDMWSVRALLKQTKIELPGFQYRIRYDERGCPLGVLWMTAEMRRNAVLYGDVLFLDAQKRQMNHAGWPYIGPVIKNAEHKPRVAAESLHLEEDTETYEWTLRAMASIESQFRLGNIMAIFGDEGIPDSLCTRLGIDAPVCGDYYHLIRLVWPQHFGPSLWETVKVFLTKMFMSQSKQEFDTNHQKACSLSGIRDNPHHLEYLDKIHQNPRRYGGYIRRSIEGAMDCRGSVPAEQNHSSIRARLGQGGIMPLAENISELLRRQQDIIRDDKARIWKHHALVGRFESGYVEQEYKDMDVVAYHVLSEFAYDKLFSRQIMKECMKLAKTTPAHSPDWVFIHPIDLDVSEFSMSDARANKKVFLLTDMGGCDCPMKLRYGVQCAHQLKFHGVFNEAFWSRRWYNYHHLNQLGADFNWRVSDQMKLDPLMSLDHLNQLGADFNWRDDPDFPLARPVSRPDSTSAVGSPSNRSPSTPSRRQNPGAADLDLSPIMGFGSPPTPVITTTQTRPKLSYQHCLNRCTELCRAVQHDTTAMTSVVMAIDSMTRLVRNKETFFSVNADVPRITAGQNPTAGSTRDRSAQFVSATSRLIPHTHSIKRKRPLLEVVRAQTTGRMNKSARTLAAESDRRHVGTKHKHKGKSCTFCKGPGHKVTTCPKITVYGVQPLAVKPNDLARSQRSDLASTLNQELFYQTTFVAPEDTKEPYLIVPQMHVKGLVIHQRLQQHRCEGASSSTETTFVCTVLDNFGDAKPRYSRALFKYSAIDRYLMRTTASIVLNCLKPHVPTATRGFNLNQTGAALGAVPGGPTSPLVTPHEMQLWLQGDELGDSQGNSGIYKRNGQQHSLI
jgi:hypothetical protein